MIYQFLWYFVIYGFLGWCIEVIYHAVKKGIIVNRGFLCGPICPVYGFGMITVLMIPGFASGEANAVAIFATGMILSTVIELLAGWILDMAFHMRWWDYSSQPFNFRGYICLGFSITWGLAVLFAVRIIHSQVQGLVSLLPGEGLGLVLLGALYIILLVDFVVTLFIVIGFNKELAMLDEIKKSMSAPADRMSKRLAENSIKTVNAIERGQVQAALAQAELKEKRADIEDWIDKKIDDITDQVDDLRDEQRRHHEELRLRYEKKTEEIRKKRLIGTGRLLAAFSDLRHRDFDDVLKEIKEIRIK